VGAVVGSFLGLVVGVVGGSATAVHAVSMLDRLSGDQLAEYELKLMRDFEDVAVAIDEPFPKELTGEKAAELITGLLARSEAREVRAFDGFAPKVGDPKLLNIPDQLEDYIKGLEDSLQQLGDDAQLANVDMQNALQKQQQTMQMMTNLGKMLHDTALAVIRKVGQ